MASTPGERQLIKANSGQSGAVLEEFVLDPWLMLSFKRALGDKRMAGVSWIAPGWAGDDHFRRLLSYKLLHAYYGNAARHFLASADAKARSDHREYGDAALLVETVRAAVIGEDWRIHVDGADDYDPDADLTPEQAPSPGQPRNEDVNDDQQATDTDAETQTEHRRAALLLDALEGWADDEQFDHALIEVERGAGKLGDGVYVLGWDADVSRPTLTTYDAGLYFPVLTTRVRSGFPRRVHIAWELDDTNTPDDSKVRVQRITWELIDTARDDRPLGMETQSLNLPWNDGPTNTICFMSSGVFTIDKQEFTVDNMAGADVRWDQYTQPDGTTVEWQRVNIGIDFIPVVHVPNTVALEAHFGEATIASVAQLLDDIADTDTDAWQASRLAGFPPIAVSKATLAGGVNGDRAAVTTYGPGTAFEVGDGNMSVLDMSAGLRALMERTDHLLSRLEVNARVPSKLLGRVKASQSDAAESGIAKLMEFGPLKSMVSEMRLVRKAKYRLLFRFVTRFLWINNLLEEVPPTAEAELAFGAFLPIDASSVVEQAVKLRGANLISEATALTMCLEAGIPIEDIAQEVIEAHATNFEQANTLLEATGDIALVAEYLGVNVAPPPPPQPVVQPGQPGSPNPPEPGVPQPAPANG